MSTDINSFTTLTTWLVSVLGTFWDLMSSSLWTSIPIAFFLLTVIVYIISLLVGRSQ